MYSIIVFLDEFIKYLIDLNVLFVNSSVYHSLVLEGSKTFHYSSGLFSCKPLLCITKRLPVFQCDRFVSFNHFEYHSASMFTYLQFQLIN